MKCPACRADLPVEANFCFNCGHSLRDAANTPSVDYHKPSSDTPKFLADKTSAARSALEGEDDGHDSRTLLDVIRRASVALTRTLDVDQFLEVVTADLIQATGVEAAGVLARNDRSNELYWREVQDKNGILTQNGWERQSLFDSSVLDRAFETGEPVVLRKASVGPKVPDGSELCGSHFVRDALVVPLNTREKTVGLLVLANRNPSAFTEEEVQMCMSLAGIIALSMENANFFDELRASYKKLEGLDRTKSKIMHRLSHELKTPLAIMKASVNGLERKLRQRGINDFDQAFGRLNRQIENLDRLELQVESIMRRGYSEEREMIGCLLESAASLIEVHAEHSPEMKRTVSLILRTLEDAFPTHQEQWRQVNVKEFGDSVLEFLRRGVDAQERNVNLVFDLENGAVVSIPELVLHATIEGLVRNAVEATPDHAMVSVRGRANGDFYALTVEDSGVGIPEEDWGLVFEGFYQLQETDSYTSGRPYAFNAGGKGMDLFRIKMFSKIYGFGLYFRSRRCPHLVEELRDCPGSVESCPFCDTVQDCSDSGGTAFQVELPLDS